MNPLTEAITKGLNEKKDWVIDDTGKDFLSQQEVKTEEKKEVTLSQSTAEKVEDKNLTNSSQEQSKKEEVKKEEVKSDPTPPKTFEELLAERTGGKIKDWKEVEAKLNETKVEFANEQAQKINDFIKNGGKFDNDWLYFQNTNFDEISEPDVLIAEAMRLREPGITDKEIAYRIKEEYKTDEWSEEENETTEVEEVMSAKMLREANKAKQELKDYQKKTSFAIPKKSEEDISKEATLKDEVQKNWEKEIEESMNGFEKVPVKIDDKETFDVMVSKEEKESLSQFTKSLGKDVNLFWNKFLNEKGNIDLKKLQQYIYKAENFDNAIKATAIQYSAKGKEGVVKDIKNIKFNQDAKSDMPTNKTMGEQIGEQASKLLLS